MQLFLVGNISQIERIPSCQHLTPYQQRGWSNTCQPCEAVKEEMKAFSIDLASDELCTARRPSYQHGCKFEGGGSLAAHPILQQTQQEQQYGSQDQGGGAQAASFRGGG